MRTSDSASDVLRCVHFLTNGMLFTTDRPVGGMTELELPESHPRYESLLTRHRIEAGVDLGITSRQGLIAQGRGEAFDYLLGERTLDSADRAERAAAAHLLRAEHAVLSVNGNVAALAPTEMVELAKATGASLEVNLFNRTETRMEAIVDHLRDHGADEVLGLKADGRIPDIDHERAKIDADGIGAADVPIVDNLVRAVPNVTEHACDLRKASRSELDAIIDSFDAEAALADAEDAIRSA